jgi:predicted tellurium resistance membrane protein TerC
MEFTSEILISLVTLSLLEVILGIDNIVFISILSGKLPEAQQKKARQYGLFIGMVVRILLLMVISVILRLDKHELFRIFGIGITGKSIILILGGLFLLFQSTKEIHHKLEGESGDDARSIKSKKVMAFSAVMAQMFFLNVVFSIDSVITAVGMAKEVWVMIAAVIISVLIMFVASEPISHFVHKHPTVKILALSFLLLIGVSLIAEGFHYPIPKGTVYFSMAFSFAVNMIQLRLNKTQQPPVNLHDRYSDKDEMNAKV